MPSRCLKLVDEPAEAPVEEQIRLLLIQRRQAQQTLAWADEELLPLRKRYAAERGEFMPPSLSRLERELLSSGAH